MKKLLIIAFVLISFSAFSQVAKGDKNLTFNLSYVGIADLGGIGILSGKFGYFATDQVEVGVTPQIFFGEVFGAFGSGIYGTYNFLTADAKLLPYAGGAFSFLTGDLEGSAIGIYGGSKYFITEAINLDAGLNLSFNLGEGGGTVYTFQLGIGFLFSKI
jgi:hypothetical protein